MQEKLERLEQYIRQEFGDEKWVCIFSIKTKQDEKNIQVASKWIYGFDPGRDSFKIVHTLVQGAAACLDSLQKNLYGGEVSESAQKKSSSMTRNSDYG